MQATATRGGWGARSYAHLQHYITAIQWAAAMRGLLLLLPIAAMTTGCGGGESAEKPQWADSVAVYQEEVAQTEPGPERAYAQLRYAVALMETGKLEAAEKQLTAAKKALGRAAAWHLQRGNLYYLQQDTLKAREAYAAAVEADPDLAEAHLLLGSLSYELGDTAQALTAFNRAIELNEEAFLPRYYRALLQKDRGYYDQALQDFNRALELRPQFAPAYLNRGLVHQAMHSKRAALNDFDKALALQDSFSAAQAARGRFYLSINQPERACPDLQAAHRAGQPVPDSLLKACK